MTLELKAVYDGKHIIPQDPELLQSYKAGLRPGAALAMTLEPWETRRSRSQQGLLHEIIGRYARANREALDTVKIRWKVDLGYYLPADKILSGDVAMPSWRGRWHDLHDTYPELHDKRTIVFLRSEADYTKRMENEFIDYAIAACESSGVDVQDIIRSMTDDK